MITKFEVEKAIRHLGRLNGDEWVRHLDLCFHLQCGSYTIKKCIRELLSESRIEQTGTFAHSYRIPKPVTEVVS